MKQQVAWTRTSSQVIFFTKRELIEVSYPSNVLYGSLLWGIPRSC